MRTLICAIMAAMAGLLGTLSANQTVTMPVTYDGAITGPTGAWLITVPCYNATATVNLRVYKGPLHTLEYNITVPPTETSPGSGSYHAVIAVNLSSTTIYKIIAERDTNKPNGFHRSGIRVTTTAN